MFGLGLVLAGGGLAGIAWETGMLLGIADEAPGGATALMDADVLLGTSAGSAVAAQIAGGISLAELFARQVAEETREIDPGIDLDSVAESFKGALRIKAASVQQKLRRIGAIAAQADTVTESVRREVIAHRLPSPEWPDRELRITAVDIATGERVVFDRTSGVPLVDAVAASCAVPGIWPPVTIAGSRYMDGGVASVVNVAAAQDCRTGIVLVPSAQDAPSLWGVGAADEIAAFPGAAMGVFADAEALAAFGSNPLDPRCRLASANAGRRQGRREAARVARFLGHDS
jgi:NTE family protein